MISRHKPTHACSRIAGCQCSTEPAHFRDTNSRLFRPLELFVVGKNSRSVFMFVLRNPDWSIPFQDHPEFQRIMLCCTAFHGAFPRSACSGIPADSRDITIRLYGQHVIYTLSRGKSQGFYAGRLFFQAARMGRGYIDQYDSKAGEQWIGVLTDSQNFSPVRRLVRSTICSTSSW